MKVNYLLLCITGLIFQNEVSGQAYRRADTVPVKENGNWLSSPWTGGHDYCQFSDIDVNFDGIKDLFVFDRTGHKVSVYINKGTPNTVDYADATTTYAPKFPYLEDWALLLDYNCDGKEDIFTYAITVGGIKVWKNTSSGGNLQFTLQTPYLKSSYPPASNLYCSRADLPAIEDVDGDGDKDVLTFDISGIYLEYHVNKSVEMGYGCDSLIFVMDPACWGNFSEDLAACNIYLNTSACRTMNPDSISHPDYFSKETNERHSGNCSLCLDMDADGDKDIVLGQISCCNLAMLINGGNATTASMISKDTTFPAGNIPVNLTLFPCGFFVDVNNDNKRDLIVAPNAPNVSVDNNSIWYYQNTGTDLAPVFKRIKRNLLQDQMIDVGEGADPVLYDFDKDGLTDMLITNYFALEDSCPVSPAFYKYKVAAYKNIGTASSPKFDLISNDFSTISSQLNAFLAAVAPSLHLTFGDVDNDLDDDMFTGDYNGKIHYYMNTAGPGNPVNLVLKQANDTDAAGTIIDIGSYSTPQLIDVDRDGDLDLLIGERSGNINYYKNIGTPAVPSFSLTTSLFGGVDMMQNCCTGYSVPFMYDSAGSYRLIVGSEANKQLKTGWIWYFKNIDGNLSGNFTLVDSMYQGIWEGLRMTVSGKDITNDGKMDLVIGNYCGGATLYLGDTGLVGIEESTTPTFDFNLYPNPSSGSVTVTIPGFMPGTMYELAIYNTLGALIEKQIFSQANLKAGFILSKGIYSCTIQTTNFTKTKKLVVVK